MPDLDGALLFVAIAGVVIVLGGGAFNTWREWADNRRIGKHLRK
jgi:hypothetical protein